MPNVFPLHGHTPVRDRIVEPLGYDDFCTLLESGSFQAMTEINGMTVLQYPRAVIIAHHGKVTCISQIGTNMDAYIGSCLAEIDLRTAATAAAA